MLTQIFGTVHDTESLMDKLYDLHLGYAKNEDERQSIYETIKILECLIGDLRRETARNEGDERYEDFYGNFHNI